MNYNTRRHPHTHVYTSTEVYQDSKFPYTNIRIYTHYIR